MNPNTSVSGGTCSEWSCPGKKATKNEIWFVVPKDIPAGEEIKLDIVGVNNPGTTRPTGTFKVTTFTPDGKFKIDDGYDTNTQMSFLGELVSFSSTQTNFVNGQKNKYIFSMESNIPIKEGDKLSYQFPKEVVPPANSAELNCKTIFGIKEIECTISGYIMNVIFKKFSNPTGTFQWSAENIRNPISTKPSSSFSNIVIVDKDLYQASAYSQDTPGITNKFTA